MPHLRLEYSANLRSHVDMGALCRELAHTLLAQRDGDRPVYPPGGVRVRAYAAEDYCVADGTIEAGFVHAALRVGTGRSEAVRSATAQALFEVMKRHFAPLSDRMGLALSLEVDEFAEGGTLKHNDLHARLAARR